MVLLDVDGARLNNLCIDKGGINENKTLTKTIKKGRDITLLFPGKPGDIGGEKLALFKAGS